MDKMTRDEMRDKFGKGNDMKNKTIWERANDIGLEYSGDISLEHGGLFYDLSNWREYGYSDAISIDIVDENILMIDVGQIHRSQVASALRCIGAKYVDDHIELDCGSVPSRSPDDIARCEIEACYHYMGLDSEFTRMCPITDGERGEYFQDGSKNISMDNLEGYILNNYVKGIVPCNA